MTNGQPAADPAIWLMPLSPRGVVLGDLRRDLLLGCGIDPGPVGLRHERPLGSSGRMAKAISDSHAQRARRAACLLRRHPVIDQMSNQLGIPVTSVGAFEAKTHFSQLLERVERGEEIVITRRGKAVARPVPAVAKHDPEAVMTVFRRLRDRARQRGAPRFDWAEWRRYVEEGRP
jgi:prevent-host-death family protein